MYVVMQNKKKKQTKKKLKRHKSIFRLKGAPAQVLCIQFVCYFVVFLHDFPHSQQFVDILHGFPQTYFNGQMGCPIYQWQNAKHIYIYCDMCNKTSRIDSATSKNYFGSNIMRNDVTLPHTLCICDILMSFHQHNVNINRHEKKKKKHTHT